jgi:DNA-binding YbaB/EbfC family protein
MAKGWTDMLKQAQQMHAKISQLQEEMAGKTIEAGSGGGMVSVVINGKQEILSIRIDPEVVTREDIEMLQDLIVAAVNEAIRKSQEMMAEEMKKITGGLSIPNLVKRSMQIVVRMAGTRCKAEPNWHNLEQRCKIFPITLNC